MTDSKRVFVLGAGFSKPAGMPLATELLPLLDQKLEHDEMREWLAGLRERLAWLDGEETGAPSFPLNIEQVFHLAHFDSEVFRLRQHVVPVGRRDGPGTPWGQAESIRAWLSYLEDSLCDVIFECENRTDLAPIQRFASNVRRQDSVLTFNYDTLVERCLSGESIAWNYGTRSIYEEGIAVHKLHGSMDWIVADRRENLEACDLLFDKRNDNRTARRKGHIEDDCRLWRCQTREQLRDWVTGRELQGQPNDAIPMTVGIAGLGAYKQLHCIPGLGQVWSNGMRSLYEADLAITVGFSMSEFDAMAQIQFAEVARARQRDNNPLRVVVIDPHISDAGVDRFKRVFRSVEFVRTAHEGFDWSTLDSYFRTNRHGLETTTSTER